MSIHYFGLLGHAPCGANARTASGSVCFDDVTCKKCLRAMSHRPDAAGRFARALLSPAVEPPSRDNAGGGG